LFLTLSLSFSLSLSFIRSSFQYFIISSITNLFLFLKEIRILFGTLDKFIAGFLGFAFDKIITLIFFQIKKYFLILLLQKFFIKIRE